MERSWSVTGLFAHLRNSNIRKAKTLPERYAALVKGLRGKVLSFKQAEKYDRLGKFLLSFPLFVFQLQLVSLADWLRKIRAKVLLDSLESLLDKKQLEFWRTQTPSRDEEADLDGGHASPSIFPKTPKTLNWRGAFVPRMMGTCSPVERRSKISVCALCCFL